MSLQIVLVAATAALLGSVPIVPTHDPARSTITSSITVRYDANGLLSEDGIARVYHQLQQAARDACEALPAIDRWTAGARRGCHTVTLEAAVSDVGCVALTAYHRACRRDRAGPRCRLVRTR